MQHISGLFSKKNDKQWADFGVRLAIGGMFLLSLFPPNAPAAAGPAAVSAAPTFTVNSLADVAASAPLDNGVCETLPGNHICTLRAAIMKANHYPGGGVTIQLPAGTFDLTTPPSGLDDETSGDLNINASITLTGAGAAATLIDAHQLDRVINVAPGSTVSLSSLTLRGGLVNNTGGGLQNSGTLTLNNSVISGNRTLGGSSGGGIANLQGTLTLNNTQVHDNLANGNAGGIYNDTNSSMTLNNSIVDGDQTIDGGYGGGLGNSGTLTLNNSLVNGNQTGGGLQTAGKGGGIANFAGSLTLTNSTVSNNSSESDGGGVYSTAAVYSYFSTIAGNLADSGSVGAGTGGGIFSAAGASSLKATLLGQNYAGAALNDGHGSINSLGYNFIQTTSGMTLLGITVSNLTGQDPLIDSPKLMGGPTPTRALFAGSPAIGAVPSAQCTDSFGAPLSVDQRGYPRPVNGACSMGAFEGQQPAVGFLRNLVRNGDAEGAASSPNGLFVPVPAWQSGAQIMTSVHYNAPGGFPAVSSDLVPANHGDNFFAGGSSLGAGGTQVIDLAPLAASLDTGNIQYDLSSDLGGYLNQSDQATVEADFLDQSSHLLTQVILGPVSAADRGNLTGFLHRSASGMVPLSTRQVEIFIVMTTVNGPYNDSYVDNVSLVLSGKMVFLPLVTR